MCSQALWQWVAFFSGYGWWGQTAAIISDSRDGCGLPPVKIPELASSVAPVTSGLTEEEGTATKHHPLPSLPRECTDPAVAAVKVSGQCLHRLEGHCHLPGPCNQDQPAPFIPGSLPLSRAQQVGTGYRTFYLPRSKSGQYTGTPLIKGITACTH